MYRYKKKGFVLFLIMLLLAAVSGCGAKDENEEAADIEIPVTENTETMEMAAAEPVITQGVTDQVDSYSILRRAGASQTLFLEEDISELIDRAAMAPAPETGIFEEPSEEPAAEETQEPEQTEVSENAAGADGTAEETPEETPEEESAENTAQASAPQPATGGGRVICIDAGHQGRQNSEKEPIGPGAAETKMKVTSGTSGVATGVPEYKLTLAVALKLQNVLQQRGYTVVMCRSSHDVNISNAERAQIANNAGASAFIRIHADGAASSSAAGGSTLAPSGSNPYCASIASQSQSLAKNVINSYCAKTGVKNRGVQITDSMTGLNWAQVPVTIIEMGFMTNPAEDQLMQTESFQQAAAEGIADGIDAFMK